MWTATLAKDQTTFEAFVAPVHDFMNETLVPRSDVRLGLHRQALSPRIHGAGRRGRILHQDARSERRIRIEIGKAVAPFHPSE